MSIHTDIFSIIFCYNKTIGTSTKSSDKIIIFFCINVELRIPCKLNNVLNYNSRNLNTYSYVYRCKTSMYSESICFRVKPISACTTRAVELASLYVPYSLGFWYGQPASSF